MTVRSSQTLVYGSSTWQRIQHVWANWVQWAFSLLYTLFAPLYDWVAWGVSAGDWRAWGRTALLHVQPGRALELGCGPGHLLPHLASSAPLAVGLDRSPAMIRLASRRKGDAYLALGTALALPFAPGAFSTIVSVFPAPYIANPATLDEAQRVLTPNGRLVIIDGAELTGRDPYTWLVNFAFALTSRPVAESPLPGRLRQRHFALTQHIHTTTRGRVLVLVAEKVPIEAGVTNGEDTSP